MRIIHSKEAALDSLYKSLKDKADKEADMTLQHIYANYFALKVAGLVEDSFGLIISEFCQRHTKPSVKNFMVSSVNSLNSIGVGKASDFFNKMDKEIWKHVENKCSQEDLDALDSLKTIRDAIAHGKHNGTGILTIHRYFKSICQVLKEIEAFLIPNP